jgi:hypothetical protein
VVVFWSQLAPIDAIDPDILVQNGANVEEIVQLFEGPVPNLLLPSATSTLTAQPGNSYN